MSNAVIDVAIGLVLMYLVLSIVCTVANEFGATVLRLRARTLETSLRQIIDVPTLQTDFYDHGLIDGATAANSGRHFSYVSGQTFASALIGSLDPTKPLPRFADIEDAIRHLPDSNIRDNLLTHVTAAQGNLQNLRDNVASWFDHAMDRVSGIYKRRLKWISLGLGFAIAFAINADSLKVGVSLWHVGALREQLAQSASTIVAAGSQSAAQPKSSTSLPDVLGNLRQAEQEIRPLPLGWNFPYQISHGTGWQTAGFWTWKIILKLLGIVMTAAAIALGAPFWFDLLSKFMNLRGTGPKPPSTTNN